MGGGKLLQNPSASDLYNRAVNFIKYFLTYLWKIRKKQFYTTISVFWWKVQKSNLPYNTRCYCIKKKIKVVPLIFGKILISKKSVSLRRIPEYFLLCAYNLFILPILWIWRHNNLLELSSFCGRFCWKMIHFQF